MLVPFALAQACASVGLVAATSSGAGVFGQVALSALVGALLAPIAPVLRVGLREVFDDPSLRDTAYALDAVAQETIWIAVVAALIAAGVRGVVQGSPSRAG